MVKVKKSKRIKWNDELAKKTALKHKTKMTLWDKDNGCYGYIRKHNKWNELAPHIPNPPTNKLSIRAWNSLSASIEALKYKTKKELRENYPSCASWITRNNCWDIVAPHLKDTSTHKTWLKYYLDNPIEGAKAGIFYVLEFKHKTLPYHFIKLGITSKSIKERYKYGYSDYEYTVITEHHTTNLKSAQIEANFLTINERNRYSFDNHIRFGGFTETLKISTKTNFRLLELLNTKFNEKVKLNLS